MKRLLIIGLLAAASAWGQCAKWGVNPLSGGFTCISPASGGPVPVCKTHTVTSTNAAFIVGDTTATVALETLPAGAIVIGVDVKHSAQFSDGVGAMSQVTVSVGSAGGGATFFTSAANIGEATAVAATTLQDTSLFKRHTSASEAMNAVFAATGRNFGSGTATYLTGGSVDIGVCWLVKP